MSLTTAGQPPAPALPGGTSDQATALASILMGPDWKTDRATGIHMGTTGYGDMVTPTLLAQSLGLGNPGGGYATHVPSPSEWVPQSTWWSPSQRQMTYSPQQGNLGATGGYSNLGPIVTGTGLMGLGKGGTPPVPSAPSGAGPISSTPMPRPGGATTIPPPRTTTPGGGTIPPPLPSDTGVPHGGTPVTTPPPATAAPPPPTLPAMGATGSNVPTTAAPAIAPWEGMSEEETSRLNVEQAVANGITDGTMLSLIASGYYDANGKPTAMANEEMLRQLTPRSDVPPNPVITASNPPTSVIVDPWGGSGQLSPVQQAMKNGITDGTTLNMISMGYLDVNGQPF